MVIIMNDVVADAVADTVSETVTSSPRTADGFVLSVIVLLGAIVTLFVVMRNKLKKK